MLRTFQRMSRCSLTITIIMCFTMSMMKISRRVRVEVTELRCILHLMLTLVIPEGPFIQAGMSRQALLILWEITTFGVAGYQVKNLYACHTAEAGLK